MMAHLKLMRHLASLPNKDRTPVLPSDKAVRAIAMKAGIKTITTGSASPGKGRRVAAKVRAMVRAQKIASECFLISEISIFINLSFQQEACVIKVSTDLRNYLYLPTALAADQRVYPSRWHRSR